MAKEKEEEISESKAWAKARGEALLKNLDILDIIENVSKSLAEVADNNEVDHEVLTEWFWGQMPVTSE